MYYLSSILYVGAALLMVASAVAVLWKGWQRKRARTSSDGTGNNCIPWLDDTASYEFLLPPVVGILAATLVWIVHGDVRVPDIFSYPLVYTLATWWVSWGFSRGRVSRRTETIGFSIYVVICTVISCLAPA